MLTSTWGGGKPRTADEIVGQVTGKSKGWIDRTGAPLAAIVQPDFADGVLPVMVSYKWAIKQVEEAGRKLPFTAWIPRVALAALIGLRDKASPQLKSVMEHLETFKAPVGQAIRALPRLADVTNEAQVVQSVIDIMKANGLNRLLVIVEEVEDPSEIRNKPGGVLGQEAYQEIKDLREQFCQPSGQYLLPIGRLIEFQAFDPVVRLPAHDGWGRKDIPAVGAHIDLRRKPCLATNCDPVR